MWVGTPVPTELQRITVDGRYYRQVYGGTLPAQIWGEAMRRIHADKPVAQLPGRVRPDRQIPRRSDARGTRNDA